MGSLFTSSSDLKLLLKEGWKGVVKFALLAGIIAMISYTIVQLAPPANDYFGALKAKHQRLDSLDSPKIIVIGGSNGAFGIDSKMLSDSLGLPIVNMSIHADLSYQFMVNEVMDHIGSGDIIISIPEYPVAINAKAKLNSAVLGALSAYPEARKYFPNLGGEASRKMLAFVVRQAFYRMFYNEVPEIYRSTGFNEHGDLISHLGKESTAFDLDTAHFAKIDLQEFKEVHGKLLKKAKEKNALVVLSLPSIMDDEYGRDISFKVNKMMKAEGIEMISETQDYLFPREYFFDTNYHLNEKGREGRTKVLIRDINSYISSLPIVKGDRIINQN